MALFLIWYDRREYGVRSRIMNRSTPHILMPVLFVWAIVYYRHFFPSTFISISHDQGPWQHGLRPLQSSFNTRCFCQPYIEYENNSFCITGRLYVCNHRAYSPNVSDHLRQRSFFHRLSSRLLISTTSHVQDYKSRWTMALAFGSRSILETRHMAFRSCSLPVRLILSRPVGGKYKRRYLPCQEFSRSRSLGIS
jgi:hypothetical protein